MEKSIGRFVAIAFVLASVLLAAVLARALHGGLFALGVEDYPILGSEFPASTVAGYLIAAVAGVVCFRNPEIRRLSNEVGGELSKVTWPTRQETWAATIVVIVTVALSAAYLGVFDAIWLWASNAILSIPNGTVTHG